MCLAVPMRITQVEGPTATAEFEGVRRRVRVDLLDGVRVGDYVLIHAGLAIAVVDENEAKSTLALLRGIYDEAQ